jgi:Flp pilus assembly protein TadG
VSERLRREDGQVLPLLVTGLLVALLGVAALVVDVGRAYVVKAQLQSTADAAALAAAGNLPATATAVGGATAFGPAGKNPVAGVPVTQTAKAWCLRSISYCYGNAPGTAPVNGQANGVVVTESASVPTTFAKLFGVDSIPVSAKSTACGMCGSQPLDIALVLDRTGSMAANMTDLKNGAKSFLQSLDPQLDYVTLLVLPPPAGADPCGPADTNVLYQAGNYAVVPITNDYSRLSAKIDCLQAGGATSYKEALVAAQTELVQRGSGRPNVQRAIVFESDGAANTVPVSYLNALFQLTDPHRDDVLRPCGSTVDYANNTLKPSGTVLFTVAYALQLDDDCYQAPHLEQTSGGSWTLVNSRQKREALSAGAALAAIASPGNAVSQANQGDMTASFQKIAHKLLGARLVPDSEGS